MPNWIANCINRAQMNLYILLAHTIKTAVHTHTTHTPLTLEEEIHHTNLNVSNETRMEHSFSISRTKSKSNICSLLVRLWLCNAFNGVKLKLNHRHIYSISVQCKWNDMLSGTSMFHIKYYSRFNAANLVFVGFLFALSLFLFELSF